MHRHMISIWFFIGSLLFIYGLIILISELVMPTPNVALAELKPGLWWGALLTVVGGVYSYIFRPGR